MARISYVIADSKERLKAMGIVRPNNKWQGKVIEHPMREIFNQYLVMDIPYDKDILALESKADLPWAEAHFQERLCGLPLNPGREYKNWPYYKRDIDNDKEFRNDGEGDQFSHSYMERFWCKENSTGTVLRRMGIRYEYGDWDDFILKFRENPHGRQHYFAIWHPEDQSPGDRRLPCTLGYYFQIIENQLVCTYHIRSCDIYRHFHNDIYMAGRLMHEVMDRLRDVVDLQAKSTLFMWIGSLHCFDGEEQLRK